MLAEPVKSADEKFAPHDYKHRSPKFLLTAVSVFNKHRLRLRDVPGDGDCGVHCFNVLVNGRPALRDEVRSMRQQVSKSLVDHCRFDAAWLLAFFVIEGLDSVVPAAEAFGNRIVTIDDESSDEELLLASLNRKCRTSW